MRSNLSPAGRGEKGRLRGGRLSGLRFCAAAIEEFVARGMAVQPGLGRPLFGPRLAEGIVAALWPSLLFLAYVAVVFAATRRYFGLRASCNY